MIPPIDNMNIKLNYIAAIVAVTLSLSGCGSKQHERDDYDTAISIEEILADSVADSSIVEQVIEEPKLQLPTTESQLTHMRSSGHWDRYQTGILPQMAEDVPEYCEKILQTEGKRFIIVDKAKMKVFLYDRYGNVEKSYGIACAKNFGTKHKKGDSRTTEGIFKVKGVFDSTEWLFTNDEGYTSPVKGQYGPRFIRLNIPYIGIHGTGSPGSIGKRVSHGCIRVTNPNILELVKYVEEGMPVIISPGPRDMLVNEQEGYHVPSVATEPGSRRAVAGRNATTIKEPEEDKRETVSEAMDSTAAPASEIESVLPAQEETPVNEVVPDSYETESSTIEEIQLQ